MANPILIYEVRDQIAYVTMNRPEKLNALNGELSLALKQAWIDFQGDDDARVAIFKGNGRAFCAGADQTPGQVDHNLPYLTHEGYPPNGLQLFKPVIAAVRGYAYGAGYALAIRGSDITICSENAQIGFPEARVGIPVAPISYLPYLPYKISLELMLLGWTGGRIMPAQRAFQLGLINAVVPADQLEATVQAKAKALAAKPPAALRATKALLKADGNEVSARISLEAKIFSERLQSGELREAITAFFEKRAPDFSKF